MKNFFTKFLAAIGAITLAFIFLVIVIGVFVWMGKRAIPEKTILEADFTQDFIENVPNDPIAKVMLRKSATVRDVVDALQRAAEDERVVGLTANIGTADIGLAQIQEIRDAVLAFRSTGKATMACAETFGEFGPGNGAYYLATAFEEIYLQPSGDIGLTGLISETPFLAGALEKLGLYPSLDHRKEYKTAMNIFTERQYTPPHREANRAVMESQFNQMVRGISAARGLSYDEVKALIDRGPFFGEEALSAKLVDGLGYRDEANLRMKVKTGEGAKFLYLSKYLERAGRPHDKGKTIALIYGVGGIQRGESGYDPLFASLTMGAETVTAAFRAATEDKNVNAIIFRVDSPGGSYVASDAIWRETVRAKEAGKPVIVTMGDVAGSGGYFVAMAADKIVAQPATITGSIGVVGGKFLTSGFWNKLGVSWDEVHTSKNATMWAGTHAYTSQQRDRFQAWLDRVYDDFTGKVAQGRELPKEKVLEVAKGRIWSGEEAKTLGLVDELGGFPVALRLAKEAAGIADDEEVRLKVFPEKKSALELLLEDGADNSEEPPATAALRRAIHLLQPVARLAGQLGLAPNDGVLTMPAMEKPY